MMNKTIADLQGENSTKHLTVPCHTAIFDYRKYFIVSPASKVSPLESKPD